MSAVQDPEFDRKLGEINAGNEARHRLRDLEPVFEKRREAIITKAFAEIQKEDLTPIKALQLWMNMYALKELERELTHTVHRGRAAGKTLVPAPERKVPGVSSSGPLDYRG